jgi:hypothetical protein
VSGGSKGHGSAESLRRKWQAVVGRIHRKRTFPSEPVWTRECPSRPVVLSQLVSADAEEWLTLRL